MALAARSAIEVFTGNQGQVAFAVEKALHAGIGDDGTDGVGDDGRH